MNPACPIERLQEHAKSPTALLGNICVGQKLLGSASHFWILAKMNWFKSCFRNKNQWKKRFDPYRSNYKL